MAENSFEQNSRIEDLREKVCLAAYLHTNEYPQAKRSLIVHIETLQCFCIIPIVLFASRRHLFLGRRPGFLAVHPSAVMGSHEILRLSNFRRQPMVLEIS